MILRLERRWFTEAATEGELLVDGAHECWTIEDASRGLKATMSLEEIQRHKVYGLTALPVGEYRLELYASPKHGPDTLQLVEVPGFEHTQIHAANRAEELLGCIAVGIERTSPTDDWIGGSRTALTALRAKVVPRLRRGEQIWIQVVERPEIDERITGA